MSKYTVTEKAMQDEWIEVQLAQQNPAKFRVLYNRYYESIFRFIFKRTVNETLSADLTSETFLKAMNKLDKYVFKGVPFSAWLFRIASNEIAQYFRKNKKIRIVAIEERTAHNLADEYEDREDLDINIKLLKNVIQELTPAEVELLELRFFEKRPFKEIANILDITENNAKVKVYRLLQKMKKRFVK